MFRNYRLTIKIKIRLCRARIGKMRVAFCALSNTSKKSLHRPQRQINGRFLAGWPAQNQIRTPATSWKSCAGAPSAREKFAVFPYLSGIRYSGLSRVIVNSAIMCFSIAVCIGQNSPLDIAPAGRLDYILVMSQSCVRRLSNQATHLFHTSTSCHQTGSRHSG